jgi:Transglycosylase-like domain
LKKQGTILLACVCALVLAASVGIPAAAQQEPSGGTDTTTTIDTESGAVERPQAEAASTRLQRTYRRWRTKLDRYEVWRGRNLVMAARSQAREPTAAELRGSIERMQTRFRNFLRSPRGRAVVFRLKAGRIPAWGRRQLASIAACESHGDPRAVGGGGTYRGMYQFSSSTWQVVGGSGDPAAASRHEQTWRAWLLLSRHGAGHWPVCG